MGRSNQNNAGTHASSIKAHRAGRAHTSEGPVSRALQDRGFGGRGDVSDQERGLGKNRGKGATGKGKAKASSVSKELRRMEKNLGVRH
jgi:hypothetical protein